MMEQVAKVLSTDDAGWVKVQVELKSACNHCSQGENCGTSAVAKAFGSRRQEFSLPSHEQYPAGTLLRLGLSESVVLKAAALVYLLPLGGLFFGGLLGSYCASLTQSNTDIGSMLGAVGLALAFWAYGKRQATQMEQAAQPVILANLGRPISDSQPQDDNCCDKF